ncbi:amidohydrolase family protein [Jiangella gansuensis]|uniref:amidohydrolase family protein n=1 Tax=Jiangella gansuensis TaxID=281473 RepID=UPI0004ACEA13|nr:amidohydrolase family protein [Jiangella gansuensis]
MNGELLDCDLLIGRDIRTAVRVTAGELAATLAGTRISGGVAGSLRALLFDAPSGNDEAAAAAADHGWWPAAGVDLRDPLTALAEVERAAAAGVRAIRLAPARQEVPPTVPGLRAVVAAAVAHGLLVLAEGDLRLVGPALRGLGARVVFLDAHFYHLGDFILLAREEPGFHASTRLLGNPDGWELVAGSVGAERLVFGSRPGWFEAGAVLARLDTARLSPSELDLVTGQNLRRLLEGAS